MPANIIRIWSLRKLPASGLCIMPGRVVSECGARGVMSDVQGGVGCVSESKALSGAISSKPIGYVDRREL